MRIALRSPPLHYLLKLLAVYSVAALVMWLLFLVVVTMVARPLIGMSILVAMACLSDALTVLFRRRHIHHLIARLLHQM